MIRRSVPARASMPDAARAIARGLAAGLPLADACARGGGAVVAGAIELHQELGGDLVAALLAIAEGLADRERLHVEARALTAQARFAARIVPLAPAGAFAMLLVLAPSAASALLRETIGLALLGVAGAMTAVALLLLRRIARGAGL